MREALQGQPADAVPDAAGRQLVRVDAATGPLPGPATGQVIAEAFLPGTEPYQKSAGRMRHRSSDRGIRGNRPPPPAPPGADAERTTASIDSCRRRAATSRHRPAFCSGASACAPRSPTWPTRSSRGSPCSGGIFDWDKALYRLDELNALAEDPKLWNNAEQRAEDHARAQQSRRRGRRVRGIESALERRAASSPSWPRPRATRARSTRSEAELEQLREQVAAAAAGSAAVGRGRRATTPSSRSMPAPAAPRARTGPRCCCACTLRWAEQHGYKVEWIEESDGEEAGIKSATLKLMGPNAYGWLKTEAACIAWCASRRSTARRAGTPASPASGSIR